MGCLSNSLLLLTLYGFCPVSPGPTPSSDSFLANGVRIHYTVEGNGEPVILVHGLGSSAWMNWQLTGVAGLLSKNYRVIALDLPGHGRSDKPNDDKAYGLQMVEDVAALMDHLDIRKAHIVGYSMGGMIAAKFLTRHQDRVVSAVIGGMGWLREGSTLQNIWQRMGGGQRGSVPPACIRSLGKLALTEAELAQIRVPAEVIVGARDPVKQLYVVPLERVRKDWPVIEIPDAGHINCIAKTQFRDEIKRWLDNHR